MLNQLRKLIAALPFIAICAIMLYTWIEFSDNKYLPTWRQYVALPLVIVNAVVYFVRFRKAVLLTGIILVLATVNLLSFFTFVQTSGITIGSVSTPGIQLWSLLILVGWVALYYSNLINWRLDLQETREKKRPG